jgi:hypothetical protein
MAPTKSVHHVSLKNYWRLMANYQNKTPPSHDLGTQSNA